MLRSPRRVEQREAAESPAQEAEEPLVLTLLRNTGIAALTAQPRITIPLPSDHEIAEARKVADRSGAELVDLKRVGIDPEAAAILPAPVARQYRAAVVGHRFGLPLVALANLDDSKAMSEIAAAIGDALVVIAPRSQLEACIEALYPLDDASLPAPASEEAAAAGTSGAPAAGTSGAGETAEATVGVPSGDLGDPGEVDTGVSAVVPAQVGPGDAIDAAVGEAVVPTSAAGPAPASDPHPREQPADVAPAPASATHGETSEHGILDAADHRPARRYGPEDVDWYRIGSSEPGTAIQELPTAADEPTGLASDVDRSDTESARTEALAAQDDPAAPHDTSGPTGEPAAAVQLVRAEVAEVIEVAEVAEVAEVIEVIEDVEQDRHAVPQPPIAERRRDAADSPDDLVSAERAVELILSRALEDNTTEVHLDPSLDGLTVRRRIEGVLHQLTDVPAALAEDVTNRLKLLAGLEAGERGVPEGGILSIGPGRRPTDVRLLTLPTTYGEKIVLRLPEDQGTPLELVGLGFLPDVLETYRHICGRSWGAVLVVGTDERGTAATLHATLAELNGTDRSVVVVGDHVGAGLPGVNQIRLRPAEGFGAAEALEAAVSSDADLVVGEIRDGKSAATFLDGSLDGRLMLGHLNAGRAAEAPHRLVEMGAKPFVVASALSAVLSQRFVRALCRRCAQPYQPPAEQLRAAGWDDRVLVGDERPAFLRPQGCEVCFGTGYRGRVALQELMVVTEDVGRALTQGAPSEEIGRLAVEEGMATLHRDGLRKAALGMTTLVEAFRAFL